MIGWMNPKIIPSSAPARAEAEIKMKREQQYQMDKETLMKMSQQSKRKSLETVDEYERWWIIY